MSHVVYQTTGRLWICLADCTAIKWINRGLKVTQANASEVTAPFSLCPQVTFEDVIAEPVSVRSGDRVWIWSNALFEVSRVWIYRIVTTLLAIPLSIISGLLFAILSCIHIWWVYILLPSCPQYLNNACGIWPHRQFRFNLAKLSNINRWNEG